ncbi:hypothetical protein JOF29_006083 [Kribbella aluminosa]|uniref:Uncharacterized protein n=1 Tax=Kribbella aluminosa TaxID=416017 RepID=A0ABS4UTK4_9ACTN|nr:hypothetical protein [Kribbella aluminosa]
MTLTDTEWDGSDDSEDDGEGDDPAERLEAEAVAGQINVNPAKAGPTGRPARQSGSQRREGGRWTGVWR